MKNKKIIPSSLKESFIAIKKHKSKIALLFLIEIIFLAAVSLAFYSYIPKISEPVREIEDYLVQAGAVDNNGVQNMLGEDPLMIYQNLNKSFYYIRTLLLLSILAYLLTGALSWHVTVDLVNSSGKNYLARFFAAASVFLSVPFLLIYNLLSPSAMVNGFRFGLLAVVLIAAAHFMLISFSSAGKKNLKEMPKRLFEVGIKKLHYMVFVYLIIAVVFVFSGLLAYLLLEINFVLATFAVVFFILAVIWSRIFFALVADKL